MHRMCIGSDPVRLPNGLAGTLISFLPLLTFSVPIRLWEMLQRENFLKWIMVDEAVILILE